MPVEETKEEETPLGGVESDNAPRIVNLCVLVALQPSTPQPTKFTLLSYVVQGVAQYGWGT